MTARPVPAIVKPGGDPDAEVQALVKRSNVARLTPAEDARLTALTFTPDADLEHARLLIERHPDLRGAVLGQTVLRLETYEPRRQAAIDAGRAVPEPSPRAIADADRTAAEYRATRTDPHLGLAERHRAAFGDAVRAGGLSAAAVKIWSDWLAATTAANEIARRRAAAALGLGHSTYADVRRPPSLIPELEAALGGGTIAETMPIIGR